ncbi:MAG: universal stress protein [Blastomonas sp.]
MKSILVYADHGPATESRLQAGLDLARARNGHLTVIQVTPLASLITIDPMGASYVPGGAIEQIRADQAALHDRLRERLEQEDVSWNIIGYDGDPTEAVLSASRLADVIIVSLGSGGRKDRPHPLLDIGELAIHAGCPVLAIPAEASGFNVGGTAMIAWDGSAESAHALRAAAPLLTMADNVHVVTIEEKPSAFPSTEAGEYLSRHGVNCELVSRGRGVATIEEELDAVATELGAELLVMGAYGHSRLRETLLGGVTRYFTEDSTIPLLLAH